jgi:hypothetical protein
VAEAVLLSLACNRLDVGGIEAQIRFLRRGIVPTGRAGPRKSPPPNAAVAGEALSHLPVQDSTGDFDFVDGLWPVASKC